MAEKAARGGSFCGPAGAQAATAAGTPLVCTVGDGQNRARWRSADGSRASRRSRATGQPRRKPTILEMNRRQLLAAAKAAGVPVRRGEPDDDIRVKLGVAREAGVPKTTDDEIRAAIEDAYSKALAEKDPESNRYVMMKDVRRKLDPRLDRAAVDRVLDKMIEDPDVRLKAELNQATLDDDDRAAAVRIGGEDRDVMAIGDPYGTPPSHLGPTPAERTATPADADPVAPGGLSPQAKDDLNNIRYQRIADGEPIGDALDSGRYRTAEETPNVPKPITGAKSTKPRTENLWGTAPTNPELFFHDDGPLGCALKDMGGDADMDVDGEPLADVVGKAATDVVVGRDTAQGCLDRMKTLRDRLPEGSSARRQMDWAIEDMDAPMTPAPELPEGTPEPLRQLAEVLHGIPAVRRDPALELEPLLDIARRAASGQAGGSLMVSEVHRLRNRRHESTGELGKFTIDRAAAAAASALDLDRRIASFERRLAAGGPDAQGVLPKLEAMRVERARISIV